MLDCQERFRLHPRGTLFAQLLVRANARTRRYFGGFPGTRSTSRPFLGQGGRLGGAVTQRNRKKGTHQRKRRQRVENDGRTASREIRERGDAAIARRTASPGSPRLQSPCTMYKPSSSQTQKILKAAEPVGGPYSSTQQQHPIADHHNGHTQDISRTLCTSLVSSNAPQRSAGRKTAAHNPTY